jgi:hypothetical protein
VPHPHFEWFRRSARLGVTGPARPAQCLPTLERFATVLRASPPASPALDRCEARRAGTRRSPRRKSSKELRRRPGPAQAEWHGFPHDASQIRAPSAASARQRRLGSYGLRLVAGGNGAGTLPFDQVAMGPRALAALAACSSRSLLHRRPERVRPRPRHHDLLSRRSCRAVARARQLLHR